MYSLSHFENFWIYEYANLVQRFNSWIQDVPLTDKFLVYVQLKHSDLRSSTEKQTKVKTNFAQSLFRTVNLKVR